MCTVSWITRADGYDLLCNRDERLDRAPARPPARWQTARANFLAPQDPEGGGSWISVNEHGIALCLLNHYPAQPDAEAARTDYASRGRIVTELATRRSIAAIRADLDSKDLRNVRAFMLLALAPASPPALWIWDGHALHEEALPRPPLTTSAYDGDRVCLERRQSFRGLRNDGPVTAPPSLDRLVAWHRTARPDAPHAGVAMRRDDAASVSLSHVRVDPNIIEMRYFEGHPSETPDQPPVICRLPAVERPSLPGDQPPRCVLPVTYDLRDLFHEKNPAMARRLPGPAYALLERLAHQDEINHGLYAVRDTPCRQFPARVLEYLGVNCDVRGASPPWPAERPIFAVNHPLGAIDGLAMLSWMLGHYPDVQVPVNDVLARIPYLAPFVTPIDKYRSRRASAYRLHETFASDAAVLVFPAGATSRYRGGRLRDHAWEKMPVRMALAHERPIVPVFIDGRLSRRFYAVARLRRLFGIRLNLEMLLLADEMFRPATPRLGMAVGETVSPRTLERLGDSDRERAQALYAACYDLETTWSHPRSLEARAT